MAKAQLSATSEAARGMNTSPGDTANGATLSARAEAVKAIRRRGREA